MKQYATVKNTLVKDHVKNQSYNLNNQYDAQRLGETLNVTYNTIENNKNIEEQYDKIQKQLIQLKLSINILSDEITALQGMVKNESSD